MNELQSLITLAESAHASGDPTFLATVVRVQGSSYRRPGARMLVTQSGKRAGGISGGCLESDILRRGWWLLRDGAAVVIGYDSTVADDATLDEMSSGFGLGCGGVIEVMLERITPGDPACPVRFAGECLQYRRPGVIATVVASEEAGVSPGQRLLWHTGATKPDACSIACDELAVQVAVKVREALETGETHNITIIQDAARTDILLEIVQPPPSLLICGAGPDAVPLGRLAHAAGWRVTVYDPRAGMPVRPESFPGADAVLSGAPFELPARVSLDSRTLAVVMTHNVALDARLLAELLPSSVGYIGLLGPRKRTERLLAALECNSDPRLHAPAGLDIGADGPESIALSILAEMQAVLAGRKGGFLRDRRQPIHDSARTTTCGSFDIRREEFACPIASGV